MEQQILVRLSQHVKTMLSFVCLLVTCWLEPLANKGLSQELDFYSGPSNLTTTTTR